ncbi:hypothetical protein B0T25DRAFT_459672 [Lasiosphaeria hispida]|uniref:FAD-binding PCMH-type domain-containing protein n=1 Tax=Lasiosphaeria hispida TaxID=260671 RepID=A0AAJ0MC90_9PEZI|nr:hypothetical protein B0T25DRAFT_459672 [Lasiosphaeria hispida]
MNEVFSFQELEGRVFMAGSKEYENSVATSNLLYRFSRPYCVFLPRDVEDVERFVREAAVSATKFNIVIKSGGHCYAGFSTAYTGVLLDLGRMTRSKADAGSETVTVGGGAQWGHVYKGLVNSHEAGLMVVGGRCPTVGVSGFVLGGGLSPFSRSLGLGCDALFGATIVTADRGTVTVKRPTAETTEQTEEEDQLFWALCGAGGGNFGVVVELKLRVEKLAEPTLLAESTLMAGRFTWATTMDTEFKDTMEKFYTFNWDNKATIDSTWLCDVKPTDDPASSGIAVRFTIVYNGSQTSYKTHTDNFGKLGVGPRKLADKLERRACAEPSTLFLHESLVAQWSEETARAIPSSNSSYSVYSSFVFETNHITEITGTIRVWVEKFRMRFRGEQAGLHVTWIHAGGKAKDSDPRGAFPWRNGTYFTYVTVEWQDKWLSQEAEEFLDLFKKALRPYSMDRVAAYVNFPDRKLTNYTEAYYKGYYNDLQKVKKHWDAKDLFQSAQGVKPPYGGSNVGEEFIDPVGEAGRRWADSDWEPLPRMEGPVGIIRDLADLGF